MKTNVTVARIEQIFTSEAVACLPDPDNRAVHTGFTDVAISIFASSQLLITGQWRATAATVRATELMDAANEWNATRPAPICFVSVSENATVHFKRGLPLMELDDNQLGYFVTSSISAIAAACGWFAERFPDLVTWENHE